MQPLLQSIVLQNILSFKNSSIELQPLNVLIGPNAVGKSNLIEAVGLLRAAARNRAEPFLQGGVRSWLNWAARPPLAATLECTISGKDDMTYRYSFAFTEIQNSLLVRTEHLECLGPASPRILLERSDTQYKLGDLSSAGQVLTASVQPSEFALGLIRHPSEQEIPFISQRVGSVAIYREFSTVPNTISGARYGASTNLTGHQLSDDGQNLALVLNEMHRTGTLENIRAPLRRFCERFQDIRVGIQQAIALTYLVEDGIVEPLPAVRISDGTLRFLCLLAVLMHPDPPPVICIEEPEIGLHPDALRLVAELLIEASQRMQVIVTTHSEALVDALSAKPETVVVCERDAENSTQFQRLSRKDLEAWLEKYRLGELWRMGEIGGNRW
ncbi:MAG TPA: AAA family ATPase [Bryobacteraceae bacterium]|nr:AAA family ATPase [Bryobacteraceae bacterium]